MKSLKHIVAEEKLFLKSLCYVVGGTLLLSFFMRHLKTGKESGEESGKAYGSSVCLLLAKNGTDVSNFSRWAELNDPSHIYGYNSAGIFTRSLVTEKKLQLPGVKGVMTENELPLPEIPASGSMTVVLENNPLQPQLATVKKEEQLSNTSPSRIPVYSGQGDVLFEVDPVKGENNSATLLIKAENSVLGPRFRVIKSSGSQQFDARITEALKQKVREGQRFSGTLSVWSGGGQEK